MYNTGIQLMPIVIYQEISEGGLIDHEQLKKKKKKKSRSEASSVLTQITVWCPSMDKTRGHRFWLTWVFPAAVEFLSICRLEFVFSIQIWTQKQLEETMTPVLHCQVQFRLSCDRKYLDSRSNINIHMEFLCPSIPQTLLFSCRPIDNWEKWLDLLSHLSGLRS